MADLFVDNAGSNTSPYETWAKAATALTTAVAAAGAGDTIYVAETHAETPTSDQTYTFAAGVRVICVNNDGGGSTVGALATTATVNGSGTAGVDFLFAGGPTYLYGITFTSGGSGTNASITIASTDDDAVEAESCSFVLATTHISGVINIGCAVNGGKTTVVTKSCTFTWGATAQGIVKLSGNWHSYGDDLVGGATVPTTLLKGFLNSPGVIELNGDDLSDISGTLVVAAPDGPANVYLWGCKMHASVTIFSPTQVGAGQVFLFDCASGDTHHNFAHYTYSGSTVAGTSIYPSGGAKYDGTNPVSWTISGNANTSKAYPYYSPWIDVYHAGTSAITPYLEAVRDGSATKYNDDEVWSEWMVKATASSTRATHYSERTKAGTASALTSSSLGASDWTGESGTAAFMKLQPDSSFTPAELGHIRARVGVSGNYAIIVDPFIRGLS